MTIDEEVKTILLKKGFSTVVDASDYDWLSQWKWGITNKGYAVRYYKTKTIYMHRVINCTPDGMVTDHIDGNKLNNRRSNLRSCTIAENTRNGGSKRGNRFKGTTWNKEDKIWHARINVDRKFYHLGVYKTAEEAAIAYNNAAIAMHGEFARLNIIPTDYLERISHDK